jgi:hypothetical protein
MGDDKKVFLRIGATVYAVEGPTGTASAVAHIVPILSGTLAAAIPLPEAQMKARAISVNTRKSVDQYLAPVAPELQIGWDDIELEGVAVKDDGARGTLPATSNQIILNSFGEKFQLADQTGVLSLELSFFQRNQKKIEDNQKWPFEGLSPAQCLSVLYAKDPKVPRSGKRYVGFRARVVKELDVDNKIEIEILEGATTKVQRRCEIEVGKIDQCDFDIDLPEVLGRAVTRIERTSKLGMVGGIFLEVCFAASLSLIGDPKTPFYQ